VNDVQSLRYRVATGSLGDSLAVEVFRRGQMLSATLPLEAPPETPPRNEVRLLGHHPLGGAFVASLSPALAEELDLPDNWSGVVITRVQRGTPANRVGFRAGDIIIAVNGQAFERSGGLADALNKISDRWLITFKRGGKIRKIDFSS
jgi:S1-C subfamily serine protease